MTPIKINGQSLEIPSSWDEVTTMQFIELSDSEERPNHIVRIISALTGIEYETLAATECEIAESVLQAVAFIGTPPDFSKLIAPDKINVGGKLLTVPKDITSETFGQKTLVQQKINECVEAKKELSSIIPFTIAQYFQPAYYDSKYNDKQAEQFESITRHVKILEAFPVANFFLSKYISSLNERANNSI
jgi:hypothetical protein